MKNFYNLPKSAQWVIAILLLIVGVALVGPVLSLTYGLLWLPLIAPLINFAFTPIFRLTGYFKYLNPFVLSTIQTNENYDLHNAFLFDYMVNFEWKDKGKRAQRTLLGHYFKALLTIIERIENEELSPQVKIVGNSYFFSDRTAHKLGFTVSKASIFWTINSAVQFLELTILYSFSQGRLTMPKFWKVKRAEITGEDLIKKKDLLQGLVERML